MGMSQVRILPRQIFLCGDVAHRESVCMECTMYGVQFSASPPLSIAGMEQGWLTRLITLESDVRLVFPHPSKNTRRNAIRRDTNALRTGRCRWPFCLLWNPWRHALLVLASREFSHLQPSSEGFL